MKFFFYKKKTAYEMRISDWSSDVCSSDLPAADPACRLRQARRRRRAADLPRVRRQIRACIRCGAREAARRKLLMPYTPIVATLGYVLSPDGRQVLMLHRNARADDHHLGKYNGLRSEEHTSELQSLMCISYAVFCLKKKNENK